ncbi:RadC family protein [Desulfuromonas sp. TF]|uniref:JAB domain-containing protein n=1 Tax=Desulfuromonas sp. TF TaxID=1232410 RepID=UPI000551D1DB|nr:DNA repair protein RadC [Desulfuromonas sp. TF]
MTTKPKTLRFKIIKSVFETLTIKESSPEYPLNRRISCSNDVFNLFRYLSSETKEHFISLHLDAKNKIQCIDTVSVGSLSASIVHPREVMKNALLSSAAAIVLVHNHPSGDPTPSREDLEITTRLKECCDLFGLRLLDHLCIGDGQFVSFADRGLI